MISIVGGGYNIYEGVYFGNVIWVRYVLESEWGDCYYENDVEKCDFNIYVKWNYELIKGLNVYLDL